MSPMECVHLGAASLAAIRGHARSAYPAECCGFLLGRRAGVDARVAEAPAAVNRCVDAPGKAFVISPVDYLRTERDAEARGLEVLGFYHSHPDAPPRPSAEDLAYAWPNTLYLVAGVHQGRPDGVGAFVLSPEGGAFRPVAIMEELDG